MQRAHKDGVKQGQEDRVRGLQRELQGDMYKDAERKHKEMLIMLRVGVGWMSCGTYLVLSSLTNRQLRWPPRIWRSITKFLIGEYRREW